MNPVGFEPVRTARGLVWLAERNEAVRDNGCRDAQQFAEIGDPVLVPPEGVDSLGWITVSGENLLDAKDNLEKTLKMLSFKVICMKISIWRFNLVFANKGRL